MTSRRALGLLTASVLGFQVDATALANDETKTDGAEAPAKPTTAPAAAKPAAPRKGSSEPEPAIKGDGPLVQYLRAVHQKVHARWADNFLPMAQAQLPRTHPVNDPSRHVVLKV